MPNAAVSLKAIFTWYYVSNIKWKFYSTIAWYQPD